MSTTHLKILSDTRISIAMTLQNQVNSESRRLLESLTQYVRTIGKFFRRLQELDVKRFVGMPLCDELISYYWTLVNQANSSPELILGSSACFYILSVVVFLTSS